MNTESDLFSLVRASVKQQTPIGLIHIPHSSRLIPDDLRAQFVLNNFELESELDRLTDHYTDELFNIPDPALTTLRFPLSRFVVDPERFSEDTNEPMASRGQGVIYELTTSGSQLRRPLSKTERQKLLEDWYLPHHQKMEAYSRSALDKYEKFLIIDCHSFPNTPLPVDLDQSDNRPDICIGTDPIHTPVELIDIVREGFEKLGYWVEINHPYSGTIVPSFAFGHDSRVSSIMIEVNRRLYLVNDCKDLNRAPQFERVSSHIKAVLARALRYIYANTPWDYITTAGEKNEH